ncbi:MAG: glycosyltransferase family 4 protein [Rhodoblastus sp.]
MSARLRIDFAFPGDLAAPTGGYGYDRRVMKELGDLGCIVRPVALPASFPFPTPDDLATARRLLVSDARDALVIDGLAYGALPADLIRDLAPRPVALVHHPLFLEAGLEPGIAQGLKRSEQAALAAAAATIVTSPMTAQIVAREFGVSSTKIFVAQPGVDVASRAKGSAAPGAKGSSDVATRLLAVGSLTPRKAYGDLFRALSRITGDWKLVVAGARDLAPAHAQALEELIGRKNLESRIRLAGAMNAQEIAAAYAGADIFVSSSHFEGFGMAIAEAVAHGLPVVVTQEVAGAGAAPAEGALVYPAGDVASLAACLQRLIEDRALRARLGDGAWSAAQRQMRWTDTARAVLDAVQTVARS